MPATPDPLFPLTSPDSVDTMPMTLRTNAGTPLARLALAALIASLAGCGGGDEEPAPADRAAAPAPSAAATRPPAPTEISNASAEASAASIRTLAETSTDASFMAAWMDASQSTAPVFVGPVLMVYGREAALRRAAVERFGEEAGAAIDAVPASIDVTLENGLKEMFQAHHFEEVRRVGPTAYVMATLEDGQPIGDAIVFRENQGEWLLLLAEGDVTWPEARIGRFVALLGPTLQATPQYAARIDDLTARVRSGEIATVEQLTQALAAARQG